MKLKIMASCALLALAACASNNTQVQTAAPKADYEVPAVYFDFNSTELSDSAKSTLSDSLSGVNTDGLKFVITGYADMQGDEDVNMAVSQKRAESVRDYLSSLSFPEDKMVVKAKGKSELASTDPDRQDVERRVEVALKDPKACKKAAEAAAAAAAGAAGAAEAADQAKDASKDNAKKNAQKANKDSDQPWYSTLFDCMCED